MTTDYSSDEDVFTGCNVRRDGGECIVRLAGRRAALTCYTCNLTRCGACGSVWNGNSQCNCEFSGGSDTESNISELSDAEYDASVQRHVAELVMLKDDDRVAGEKYDSEGASVTGSAAETEDPSSDDDNPTEDSTFIACTRTRASARRRVSSSADCV